MRFDIGKLVVLYEDNHVIVVVKPVGILSQGDNTGADNMVDILKCYIKEKYSKPGNVFVGLVHRLDRMVGGVMVFAKTSKGASRLSEVIRNRTFGKKYYAAVEGKPQMKTSELHHYIQKDSQQNKVCIEDKLFEGAKSAALRYEVLDYSTDTDLSLVSVELLTGRPHQIRAQFSYVGHPLFGDCKYNKRYNSNGKTIGMKHNTAPGLWSYYLSFKHPVRDEVMEFSFQPDMTVEPWCFFKTVNS